MADLSCQEPMQGNHCWGCGALNEQGLQIRSYWDGDESVCTWTPGRQYMAGPRHVVNGGIITSLIDCHSICTAIAKAYDLEGRPIGAPPTIWYVTGSVQVTFRRPTSINDPVTLRARIVERTEKRTNLICTLYSNDEECASGNLVAVRVPPAWLESP